jgi:membrane protein
VSWASSGRVRGARRSLGALARRGPVRTVVGLVTRTIAVCLRYRVTGLAAEAGFFALLSLPPLVLGLAGSAAWIGSRLSTDTALQLKNALREYLSPFLTDDVVNTVIIPTLEDALDRPRLDLVSIGFVLSLWSGSRALNVYLDTISIMYGLGGHRSIVRTRLLSFGIYVLVLLLGAVTLPLVLVGPTLIGRALPTPLDWLLAVYWPVVTLLGVALLATLYHVSVPLRTSWRRDLPGAVLALVIWVLASALLRAVLGVAVPGAGSQTASLSIYGPLTTPIVVLVWLYLLAIAVLIGAALNAVVDETWPHGERSAARQQAARRAGEAAGTLTPVRDAEAERDQQARWTREYGLGAAAALTPGRSDRDADADGEDVPGASAGNPRDPGSGAT